VDALFDPVFGMTRAAQLTGPGRWLAAMCRFEAALARACEASGLLDAATVALVVGACDPAGLDLPPAEIAAGGNPVIPLVTALRRRAGTDAVHLGATSQDVLDTAAMLLSAAVLDELLADLAACADECAALAGRFAGTAMIARTLLQQAVPTTFGAVAAGWGAGLDRARGVLARVRGDLAVQLGGAAGTLAGWYPHGPAVRAAVAADLGLADPLSTWHTDRTRIAELAGALGTVAVAVGKTATDIVLLSQSEIAELAEAAPGGSSAMPHKRNPIAAVTARAAAAQVPGLVATLLAAGAPELQRGAGPWHAEWPALQSLLRATAGSAVRLRVALTGLVVDPAAMAARLDGPPELAPATELVAHYLKGRADG
jgi:3-carboxy-cis,cis-muconate cycloisomerase